MRKTSPFCFVSFCHSCIFISHTNYNFLIKKLHLLWVAWLVQCSYFLCVFLLFSISDSWRIQKRFFRVHLGVRRLFWGIVVHGGCAGYWCPCGASQLGQLVLGGPPLWAAPDLHRGKVSYWGIGFPEPVAWINMNSNRVCDVLGRWPRRFYREAFVLEDLLSQKGVWEIPG